MRKGQQTILDAVRTWDGEVLARAAREEPDDELKPMLRKLLKKR